MSGFSRIRSLALLLAVLLMPAGPALAQEPGPAPSPDEDGSSEQVESSDDAYRRRMELEDARHRDPSYTDPVDSYKKDLEKIDKLPEESRDNIRDQLIDVIVENGEWEPSDALEEYPYEPTDAAKADPELMKQEQEAWEEQITKYHEREAAAFGAYRGPVPGPGNPDGAEGGGQAGEGSEQGQGSAGGSGGSGGSGNSGSGGTYRPYQSGHADSEDETSTAGVSESALDFLRRQQAQSSGQGQPPQTLQTEAQPGESPQSQGQEQLAAETPEGSPEAPQDQPPEAELEPDTRGIMAIEDLDKLEGAIGAEEPDEEEPPN